MAYDNGVVGLHAIVKVRFTKIIDGKLFLKIIKATLGRIIFNEAIPQDLGFIDRSDRDKIFDLRN